MKKFRFDRFVPTSSRQIFGHGWNYCPEQRTPWIQQPGRHGKWPVESQRK